MSGTTVAVVGVLVIGAGLAVAYVAKQTKPAATIVAQAPSPAVAGIQALGQLASKGIDLWIAKKVASKEMAVAAKPNPFV